MSVLITPENKIRSAKHCANAIRYAENPEKAIDVSKVELHDKNALKYISRDEKAFKVSTRLCSQDNTSIEFETVRKAFGKNNGILIQHYIQSFSPEENITPDEAHQMALELVDKIAVGYQVMVSTHIDKEHIHNHIFINNVSPITGLKFPDNKTTLREYRKINDEISRLHNKSVIENEDGKYVSRGAKETANRGVSYKKKMCDAIDVALSKSNDLNTFISQMNLQGYGVRTGKYITIIDINNSNHRCRTDTLAKQFGDKYNTENLYKLLGEEDIISAYEKVDSDSIVSNSTQTSQVEKNYKRVIDRVSNERNFTRYFRHAKLKYSQQDIINHQIAHHQILAVRNVASELRSPNGTKSLAHFISSFRTLLKLQQVRYNIANGGTFSNSYLRTQQVGNHYILSRRSVADELLHNNFFGNIDYNNLYATAGETLCIDVPYERIPRLLNAPMLYGVQYTSGSTCNVYIKAQDKEMLESLLGVTVSEDKAYRRPFRNNSLILEDIKSRGDSVSWQYSITENQARALHRSGVESAIYASKKIGRYNIAYSASNEVLISKILNPERKQTGNVPYPVFKRYTVNEGIKPSYWKLSEEQYSKLIDSELDIFSSAFPTNDGGYNLVYLPQDRKDIQAVIYNREKTKSFADIIEERGSAVNYITVSSEQLTSLRATGILLNAVKQKGTSLFVVAFDKNDSETVKQTLQAVDRERFDRGADASIIRSWQDKGTQYAWRRNVTKAQVESIFDEGTEIFYVKSGDSYSIAYRKEDEKSVQKNLGAGTVPSL